MTQAPVPGTDLASIPFLPDDIVPTPPDPAAEAVALELSLDPMEAARLPRAPALARPTGVRLRAVPLDCVWHDTADGALARAGQALARVRIGRGVTWQLHRVVPGPGALAPGRPTVIEAEAPAPDALLPAPPGLIAPVAAMVGQQRSFTAGGGIQVMLLDGVCRGVVGERAVARVVLHGRADRVVATALALADTWLVSPSGRSLAAEALDAAGRAAPSRRLGAPDLPPGLDVEAAFEHIVGHLAGVILHYAPLAQAGQWPEPVHQMRVAMRRLRSALSLFKRAVGGPALDDARAALRPLAKVLGPARDWDVFTTGTGQDVAHAFPDDKAVERLIGAAERQRRESYARLLAFLDGPEFRRAAIHLAVLAGCRPWRHHPALPEQAEAAARAEALRARPLPEFAARALSRRLDHVLGPGSDLSALSMAELHELRIQGKKLRYAAEFFAPLYPGRQTGRFIRRVARLQERLGTLNDGRVAAALMAELTGGDGRTYAAGVVRGFVAARGGVAHGKLDRAWQKFRHQSAFWPD